MDAIGIHRCEPLTEENNISVALVYFYQSFIYDNMVITVTDYGDVGAQLGGDTYPYWSDRVAKEHLPEAIYQAAIMWRKSGNAMPVYEFLNAMFNL